MLLLNKKWNNIFVKPVGSCKYFWVKHKNNILEILKDIIVFLDDKKPTCSSMRY